MSVTERRGEPLFDIGVAYDKVPPTTHVRSTWLAGSLNAIRKRNLYREYVQRLPGAALEQIESMVPGTWVAMPLVKTHYAAVDALDWNEQTRVEIGREVIAFAYRSSYSIVIRLVREAGVTPWTCIEMQTRFWSTTFRGGALAAFRLGPKEARIEVLNWPLAEFAHTRIAWRGILAGLSELFCTKAYVKEIPGICTPTTLGYTVSWA